MYVNVDNWEVWTTRDPLSLTTVQPLDFACFPLSVIIGNDCAVIDAC